VDPRLADPVIRRTIADGDLAYFSTWCPAKTAIETLVAVEGHRWAVEDAFETAKSELGAIITRPDTGMAGTATSRW
jgi:SRSO17 transposase